MHIELIAFVLFIVYEFVLLISGNKCDENEMKKKKKTHYDHESNESMRQRSKHRLKLFRRTEYESVCECVCKSIFKQPENMSSNPWLRFSPT